LRVGERFVIEEKKMNSMDLRQAFAGLLTLSMFIMLGNMIKKDHFDYSIDDVSHSHPSPLS
jgi:hypothetical protein